MTKSLSSSFVTQKNTLAATSDGSWFWGVTLDRDGTNYLRYCAPASDNKTFNSNTYTATEMEVQPPYTDMGGTAKNFSITIQNVDQVLIADLENDEFLDRPVLVELLHTDHLSNTSNVLSVHGVVISASADEKWVTFECGAYDLRDAEIPKGRYLRDRCRWVFKSDECGYSGGQTSCDKTLTTCDTTMSNQSRYGGFPGMPMQRP